ncbi:MAG: LPP20 family lipoprotein [Breznakibacter sp.]
MMRTIVTVTIMVLLMAGCGSSKNTKVPEVPRPGWVDGRPYDPANYSGIGIVRKWGSPANYQSEAREKALADMAAQINTHISTTSVLHQIENKQGVSEMLTSQTKASSKEFLEGYEQVGEWQDETTFCVYYKLSKQKFASLKEQRRQTAMVNAQARFAEADQQNQANQCINAMKLYASSLEALRDYLGESNITETPQGTIDVAIQSLKQLKALIADLRIIAITPQVNARTNQVIPEDQLTFAVSTANGVPQTNVPVAFSYSGGFLRTDTKLSDANGQAGTAIHLTNTGQGTQTLCAKIDVVNLSRQLTRDLLVRKLVEETAANSACTSIKIE